jgi:hypothetical protein
MVRMKKRSRWFAGSVNSVRLSDQQFIDFLSSRPSASLPMIS